MGQTVLYDDGQARPAHSDRGASSAERWMKCPGSTALINAMNLPESDEADYTREGIAGHEAAAHCLENGCDSWEIAGETFHKTVIDPGMAEAVQVYVDYVRPMMAENNFHGESYYIEAKLAAPDVHAKMFGSVDFGTLCRNNKIEGACVQGFLAVVDLKMGMGIVVEAEDNPQMKYYAFMLLHTTYPDLESWFPVRLSIVQPRVTWTEPVREWWTTVGEINRWAYGELIPAMQDESNSLMAGEWCRFCPAKLACPMLQGLFKAAATVDPKETADYNDNALGLNYGLIQPVKSYLKALEAEIYRRLMAGAKVPNTKLVNKRADRIFKDGVTETVEGSEVVIPIREAVERRFGQEAFTAPELKSPAQLEKISAEAKEFVKQYAYMPVTGLTVASEKDRKPGVAIKTVRERFSGALAKLEAEALELDEGN